MTKQSPGVRISNDVWRKLQHLKADTGKSIGKLVEEAVALLVEKQQTDEDNKEELEMIARNSIDL